MFYHKGSTRRGYVCRDIVSVLSTGVGMQEGRLWNTTLCYV